MKPLSDLVKKEGYENVARRLGCRYQRIQHWIRNGSIPAHRAIEVEAKLGIPRHELRPDLWDPPSSNPPAT